LFQFQSVLHRIQAIKFPWHLMCLSSHLTMLITLILIVDLVPLSLPCCYNRHEALLEIFLMQNFNQEHLFLSCLLTWYRQRIPSYTSQYWWSLTPHQVGSCKISMCLLSWIVLKMFLRNTIDDWTRFHCPCIRGFISCITHHQVHFLCFEVAVLIIHQSKGNCELQIQTFREFSAQTSYSQKWSQKIRLITAFLL
jgi:hypothetical protein